MILSNEHTEIIKSFYIHSKIIKKSFINLKIYPVDITATVAVAFRYPCLPVFAWRRVVVRLFDPKQLFRVSCTLWCYFSKCYLIILQNGSLWCSIAPVHEIFQRFFGWLSLIQTHSYTRKNVCSGIKHPNLFSSLTIRSVVLTIKLYDSCTLKMCSLLKIENNSSWVNFTHFREKTHLLALELIFVSSSWQVYMNIKFYIKK